MDPENRPVKEQLMEDQKIEKKKRQFNPDRIVLEAKSVELVKKISAQIELAFNGVIKLTNKEIANFLIQARSTELTANELRQMRELHFDEVRAAMWAVQKLKVAREKGEDTTLAQIIEQIQTPKTKRPSQPSKAKRASEPPVAAGTASKVALAGSGGV